MVYVLGIDIGSASSKGIALGNQGPLGSFECPLGEISSLRPTGKIEKPKLRKKYIGMEEAFKV